MISLIAAFLRKLLSFLPDFEVKTYIDNALGSLSAYMGYLNWLIPFNVFLDILVIWCECMSLYFTFITGRAFLTALINKFIK
jgi:hypothetical protein